MSHTISDSQLQPPPRVRTMYGTKLFGLAEMGSRTRVMNWIPFVSSGYIDNDYVDITPYTDEMFCDSICIETTAMEFNQAEPNETKSKQKYFAKYLDWFKDVKSNLLPGITECVHTNPSSVDLLTIDDYLRFDLDSLDQPTTDTLVDLDSLDQPTTDTCTDDNLRLDLDSIDLDSIDLDYIDLDYIDLDSHDSANLNSSVELKNSSAVIAEWGVSEIFPQNDFVDFMWYLFDNC